MKNDDIETMDWILMVAFIAGIVGFAAWFVWFCVTG